MRNLAVLMVPLLCSAAGAPPEIDSVLARARALPGEFAADAMIRIAALDGVEKARKVVLLEEAYRRASEAQEPYLRRAGITRIQGSAGFYTRAFNQELDGLSLRLRAVDALLPLDTAKARDLFLQIPRIQLPKLKCADFLVYDVDRYYEVMSRVASSAYTPQQIAKGEPMHLLLDQAGAITSPVQVNPMARAILQSKAKDGDFQAMVG